MMYGNNYQPTYPMYNPYQNQQNNYLPPMPMGLSGRIVDDFGSVTVNDVPMDGNPAVFIKKDNSEIVLKKWGNDGRIYSVSYLPQIENKDANTINVPSEIKQSEIEALTQRLEGIESKIDKLIRPVRGKETKDES